MDVNIVYFATHGSTAMEPTSWSAIIIEDGEMESLTGFEHTSLTAILSGLEHCLSRMPSSTPIILRSPERDIHQIGNSWIKNWMQDGFAEEPDAELIAALLDTLESRKVQWFKPPFTDPLDKQVQALALEEWNNIPEPSSIFESELTTTTEPVTSKVVDTLTEEECTSNNNFIPLDSPSEAIHSSINPTQSTLETTDEHQDILSTPYPTEEMVQQNTKTSSVTIVEVTETDVHSKISAVQDTKDTEEQHEALLEKNASVLSVSEDVIQVSSPLESLKISTEIDIFKDASLDNTPDEILYPYVDAEGLKQADDIFCEHADQTIHDAVPSRILGYIDAVGYGQMGSWCFILIDYPSQFALIKGQANRNSTGRRALLQGCIEVLMSIRNRSHTIEIRTSNREVFDLVHQFIQDPMTMDIPQCWEDEGAFVSQLSYWIEQCKVSVRLLSTIEIQRDQAIRETNHLAKDNLNNINQGLPSTVERRRKFYPLERLII